jgi:hypothetical protein
MMSTDWKQKAEELRQLAKDSRRRSQESFERSDTDGFLSQWASDLHARLYEVQAEIADQEGKSEFPRLFEGDRMVLAIVIDGKFGSVWLLDRSEQERFGRTFVPTGEKSRVQKKLGLHEGSIIAPAYAKITGRGTGLSGSAWVAVFEENPLKVNS